MLTWRMSCARLWPRSLPTMNWLCCAPEQADIREVLASNLEELHRLTGIVNDMLFLSQADRGVERAAPPWRPCINGC